MQDREYEWPHDQLRWVDEPLKRGEWRLGHPFGGLNGSEDPGAETKAVFRLEDGFNAVTRALGQDGTNRNRFVAVGLPNYRYGTLLLGPRTSDHERRRGLRSVRSDGLVVGLAGAWP